jgi:CheY-like chemotaxis protein
MQPAAKSNNARRRRLSVLIADDNADVLATLSALLSLEGHVVSTCLSGKEALQSIERLQPDVCIIDIVMPDLSGYDIAREVQALGLPRRPVMFAISGQHTKTSDMLLARATGFDHYLTKGADPQEVLRLLDTIAGNRPPAR